MDCFKRNFICIIGIILIFLSSVALIYKIPKHSFEKNTIATHKGGSVFPENTVEENRFSIN